MPANLDSHSCHQSRGPVQGSRPIQTTSPAAALNTDAPPFSSTTITSLFVKVDITVLLQTARAVIRNPKEPHIHLSTHAVLDLRSQRFYITQWAAAALSLEPVETHQLSVFTFGLLHQILVDCQLVHT